MLIIGVSTSPLTVVSLMGNRVMGSKHWGVCEQVVVAVHRHLTGDNYIDRLLNDVLGFPMT